VRGVRATDDVSTPSIVETGPILTCKDREALHEPAVQMHASRNVAGEKRFPGVDLQSLGASFRAPGSRRTYDSSQDPLT
jgi:hypothetical protein